ncbi:hypothetical protein ACTFIT_008968 [Dictyostelium discoideum]
MQRFDTTLIIKIIYLLHLYYELYRQQQQLLQQQPQQQITQLHKPESVAKLEMVYHLNPCRYFMEGIITNVLEHQEVICSYEDLKIKERIKIYIFIRFQIIFVEIFVLV